MTPVLAQAAEALRKVGGDGFEIEVSVEVSQGPVAAREKEKPRKTGGPGGADEPRETGQLAVRRGEECWRFRALEVGRLTKKRAAQLLSTVASGGGLSFLSAGRGPLRSGFARSFCAVSLHLWRKRGGPSGGGWPSIRPRPSGAGSPPRSCL